MYLNNVDTNIKNARILNQINRNARTSETMVIWNIYLAWWYGAFFFVLMPVIFFFFFLLSFFLSIIEYIRVVLHDDDDDHLAPKKQFRLELFPFFFLKYRCCARCVYMYRMLNTVLQLFFSLFPWLSSFSLYFEALFHFIF